MKNIRIESASVEALTVTIRAAADPTAETIEFVATADTATSPTGTWVAGSWGTWTGSTVTVTTPTIGATGADIEVTEGGRLILWCRIGGAVVMRAARLVVT